MNKQSQLLVTLTDDLTQDLFPLRLREKGDGLVMLDYAGILERQNSNLCSDDEMRDLMLTFADPPYWSDW